MSQIPEDLKYTSEHEWIRFSADRETATIGITDYAQESLGDVTFVELPAVGESIEKGDIFGVVESVKAASDLYVPLSGEVLETNEVLESAPELLNSDPYGEAWMIKIKITDITEADDLMPADEYQKLL